MSGLFFWCCFQMMMLSFPQNHENFSLSVLEQLSKASSAHFLFFFFADHRGLKMTLMLDSLSTFSGSPQCILKFYYMLIQDLFLLFYVYITPPFFPFLILELKLHLLSLKDSFFCKCKGVCGVAKQLISVSLNQWTHMFMVHGDALL